MLFRSLLLIAGLSLSASAAVVRLEFSARIATVSGNPFGLDGNARDQMVSGYLQYDTATPDSSPAPERGEYLHAHNGDFRAELPGEIVVTGSPTPQVQVENFGSDTFRFSDGISVFQPTVGAMSVNGVADEGLQLTLAMTDSTGAAIADDTLPANFPFTPAMPHTFSLKQGGGTLLLQLETLAVPQGPAISAGGVADAASFGAKLAPGALASLFGVRLGFVVSAATELPLPTELDGVSVLVDGRPAGLIYVSPGQINFQVPFEVADGDPGVVTVVRNGLISAGEAAVIAGNAPAVFVANGNAITTKHSDGSLVTEANRARPGDVLIVYVTGLGNLDNPPPSGHAAGLDPLSTSRMAPVVTLGGAETVVYFSGLAPGFAGLGQINIQLPAQLPQGEKLPLVVAFGADVSAPVNVPVAP